MYFLLTPAGDSEINSGMNQFAIRDTNAIFLFSLTQTTLQIGMKEICTSTSRISVTTIIRFQRLYVPDPQQFEWTVA